MAINQVPSLLVESDRQSTVTLVRCTGQVDIESWAELSVVVRALLAEGKPIRVDLSEVTRVDSTGIGALVGLWTAAKRRNCDLKYTNPAKRVEDVIRLTGLLGMVEGHSAEERQLGATLGS